MSDRMFRLIAAAGCIVLLSGSAGADGARRLEDGDGSCSIASLRDVRLPRAAEVDEIRVVVPADSPITGAARITVAAGQFDRALSVRGPISHSLSFHPPLSAETFHIAVDPVMSAPESICVTRVELRSRGALVAAIQL
jgi:hypothetical protein